MTVINIEMCALIDIGKIYLRVFIDDNMEYIRINKLFLVLEGSEEPEARAMKKVFDETLNFLRRLEGKKELRYKMLD